MAQRHSAASGNAGRLLVLLGALLTATPVGAEDDPAKGLRARAAQLYAQGKYGPAFVVYRRARKVFEEAGKEIAAAQCLAWEADCLLNLGRDAAAVEAAQQALRRLRAAKEHPQAIRAANLLGRIHMHFGRYEEAAQTYEGAWMSAKRAGLGDRVELITTFSGLGSSRMASGDVETAHGWYEHGLAMARRLKDTVPAETAAIIRNNLSECLWSAGETKKSLPLIKEALSILRERAPNSRHLPTYLRNLAIELYTLGRAREALRYYQEALAVAQRIYKGNHLEIADALSGIAGLLVDLGRAAEAQGYLEKTRAMLPRIPAGNKVRRAAILFKTAACLRDLGRYDEALPLYEGSLAIMRRLRREDGLTARIMVSSASCLANAGRFRESLDRIGKARTILSRLYPGDHPVRADVLGISATILVCVGRPTGAIDAAKRSLAMEKRLRTGDHARVASALSVLAGCLGATGHLGQSIELYREALAMERRLHPGDNQHTAASLRNLGRVLNLAGRSGEGRTHLESALKTYRAVFPNDSLPVALFLQDLAKCLSSAHRPLEARRRFLESNSILRRCVAEDHPAIAINLTGIAHCSFAMGRIAKALKEHREVLARHVKRFGRENDHVAISLAEVGKCLHRMGRMEDAWPKIQESLAIKKRLFDGDHPEIAIGLGLLADVLADQGRLPEAIEHLERSLSMLRRLHGGDHRHIATCLNNLGYYHGRLGQLEEAKSYGEAALAMESRIQPAANPRLGGARIVLARILRAMKKPKPALALTDQAVRILRGCHQGDHPSIVGALYGRGEALFMLRRDAEALETFESALAMSRRLFPNGHWTTSRVIRAAGDCLARLGRQDEAKALLEESVAMGRRMWIQDYHATLVSLAQLCKPGQAVEFYEEAIAEIEDLRFAAAALSQADRGAYYETLQSHGAYDGMVRARLLLKQPREALRYLEQSRARSLLDLLEHSRFDPLDEAERRAKERGDPRRLAQFAKMRRELRAADDRLGVLFLSLAATQSREDLAAAEKTRSIEAIGKQLRAARDSQRKALRRRAHLIRDDLEPARTAEPVALQRMLRKGEYLLIYSLTDRDGLLLLVPPAGERVEEHPLTWHNGRPLTAGSATQSVDHLLRTIRESRRTRGMKRARETTAPAGRTGFDLLRALVPPKVWQRIAKAERVYLVPHGALHRLPFEMLPLDEKNTRSWLDAGPPIAYGASGSALLWCQRRRDAQIRGRRTTTRLVALGNPVFAEGLARLPGTQREVEAIRAALPDQTTTLLGKDATESRLFALAPQARYLHLATHQLADETEWVSYSGLALTQPHKPSATDDGHLRLIDLLERWRDRIRGCELVVLSACETKTGYLRRDEGVFAMPWGFMYAGAPSVIASLWRVDDQSTADLFSDFYKRLAQGKSKLEAFTEARKALRKKYPQPYHWAPFIYIGDPR